MENKIRSTLNEIYFGKTKDIVNDLRSVGDLSIRDKQKMLASELTKKLQDRD
jgi:capping protein beta